MLTNKKIFKFKIIPLLIWLVIFGLTALPVLAKEFNPHYIIDDAELRDKDSLGQEAIQRFLTEKNSPLATYICLAQGKDKAGNEIIQQQISAATAFYEIAQRWSISPKFLLDLVQKEQSLVEDTTPSEKQFDWATGYAICDGCSLNDPALQRWRGFYKQVNSAAAQFDYYLENPNEFRYKKGGTYNIDGTSVTPQNIATATMYNYTPHLHGNELFNNIWNRWFSKNYPDGSLIKTKDSPDVWYLQYGTRRPIKSKLALKTRFDESKIIEISPTDLESYPLGWPITFANYSLLQSPLTKQIYLIVDDEKRPIVSQEVFRKIGWNPDEVTEVAQIELDNLFEGDLIDENTVYPQGLLAQNKTSGETYFIQDGARHPIIGPEVMANNFPGRKSIKLSATEIAKYELGDPVKLKDGTLVKGAGTGEVYVVSNSKLRWIANEETFLDLGYKWSNIIIVPLDVMNLHLMGDMLTI